MRPYKERVEAARKARRKAIAYLVEHGFEQDDEGSWVKYNDKGSWVSIRINLGGILRTVRPDPNSLATEQSIIGDWEDIALVKD